MKIFFLIALMAATGNSDEIGDLSSIGEDTAEQAASALDVGSFEATSGPDVGAFVYSSSWEERRRLGENSGEQSVDESVQAEGATAMAENQDTDTPIGFAAAIIDAVESRETRLGDSSTDGKRGNGPEVLLLKAKKTGKAGGDTCVDSVRQMAEDLEAEDETSTVKTMTATMITQHCEFLRGFTNQDGTHAEPACCNNQDGTARDQANWDEPTTKDTAPCDASICFMGVRGDKSELEYRNNDFPIWWGNARRLLKAKISVKIRKASFCLKTRNPSKPVNCKTTKTCSDFVMSPIKLYDGTVRLKFDRNPITIWMPTEEQEQDGQTWADAKAIKANQLLSMICSMA